jgi:two-component system, OmpR family, response regulator VanR
MNTEKTRKVVTIIFDPGLRALLNDFMSSHTFGVESANDSLDAFHKLAKNYFDLIITDMQMPGFGGVALLPRLKRIQPWARVIVIPTRRIKRRERQIVESSADACIEKPFNLGQLKTVIQGIFPMAEDTGPSTDQHWNQGALSWQAS